MKTETEKIEAELRRLHNQEPEARAAYLGILDAIEEKEKQLKVARSKEQSTEDDRESIIPVSARRAGYSFTPMIGRRAFIFGWPTFMSPLAFMYWMEGPKPNGRRDENPA